MHAFRLRLPAAFALISVLLAGPASAGGPLDIYAYHEKRPGLSWLVVGTMLMEYFDVPATAQDGTLACSIANFVSGAEDCREPAIDSQFQAVKQILGGYWKYSGERYGQSWREMRWEETKILPPDKLIHEIDFLRGVVAEIAPVQPGAESATPHVVLIVGTTGGAGDLSVIVNDPVLYDEAANPYLEAGGRLLDEGGQYEIGYEEFKTVFKWSRTLFRVKPE